MLHLLLEFTDFRNHDNRGYGLQNLPYVGGVPLIPGGLLEGGAEITSWNCSSKAPGKGGKSGRSLTGKSIVQLTGAKSSVALRYVLKSQ